MIDRRAAMAATAVAGVFLFVWEQLQATRTGFELERMRRSTVEARSRNAYLRLELDRLTTPAELASIAQRRLGMLPPTPDSLVLLAQAGRRPLEAPQLAQAPQRAPITASAARFRIPAMLLSWLDTSQTNAFH